MDDNKSLRPRDVDGAPGIAEDFHFADDRDVRAKIAGMDANRAVDFGIFLTGTVGVKLLGEVLARPDRSWARTKTNGAPRRNAKGRGPALFAPKGQREHLRDILNEMGFDLLPGLNRNFHPVVAIAFRKNDVLEAGTRGGKNFLFDAANFARRDRAS